MRQVVWGQNLDGTGPTALQTIDGILKEDYVMENIVNTVNMATYMLSRLSSERTTAGRRYIFPVQFGVGEGQGSRGENELLPEEGFGEYDQAMGVVRFQYGSMYITGPSIEATEGGRATFASALKQSLKDVRDGFKLDTQRQVWGDGSGTIALVADPVNNSVTVPVTDPYGYEYVSASLTASQKVRLFRRNMKVHFITAGQIRTVKGVNPNGTITLDAAVTLVAGDRIVRGDATNRTSNGKEIEGIGKAVSDTGSYLTIDRTGLPEWQGNITDIGANDLSEDIIQAVFDQAEINGSGEDPDLLISEHLVRRFYVKLLQGDKRFVNTLHLQGGFKALDFNGQPWVVDKHCPPQRLYYMRLADWTWFTMKNIGWLNRDGTILKWVENRDAYRAILAAYRNLACKKPANQSVLMNIKS
jgi:hypothetical protein